MINAINSNIYKKLILTMSFLAVYACSFLFGNPYAANESFLLLNQFLIVLFFIYLPTISKSQFCEYLFFLFFVNCLILLKIYDAISTVSIFSSFFSIILITVYLRFNNKLLFIVSIPFLVITFILVIVNITVRLNLSFLFNFSIITKFIDILLICMSYYHSFIGYYGNIIVFFLLSVYMIRYYIKLQNKKLLTVFIPMHLIFLLLSTQISPIISLFTTHYSRLYYTPERFNPSDYGGGRWQSGEPVWSPQLDFGNIIIKLLFMILLIIVIFGSISYIRRNTNINNMKLFVALATFLYLLTGLFFGLIPIVLLLILLIPYIDK